MDFEALFEHANSAATAAWATASKAWPGTVKGAAVICIGRGQPIAEWALAKKLAPVPPLKQQWIEVKLRTPCRSLRRNRIYARAFARVLTEHNVAAWVAG